MLFFFFLLIPVSIVRHGCFCLHPSAGRAFLAAERRCSVRAGGDRPEPGANCAAEKGGIREAVENRKLGVLSYLACANGAQQSRVSIELS